VGLEGNKGKYSRCHETPTWVHYLYLDEPQVLSAELLLEKDDW